MKISLVEMIKKMILQKTEIQVITASRPILANNRSEKRMNAILKCFSPETSSTAVELLGQLP